jgi:thiol-disulfide isomerase/thioredoxin
MATNKAEREKRRRQGLAERRIYLGLGVGLVLLAAIAIVTVSSSGNGTQATPPAASPQVAASAGATDPSADERGVLAANVRQANQILDTTIQAKVLQLPGVPIVINQWASWCTNCRLEFPFFQQAGRANANRVAFVGLDSQDSQSNALAFRGHFPGAYPTLQALQQDVATHRAGPW